MKKIFYILASAIVALGAVACQNEVDENINPNDTKEITFNVSFDESTRIAGTVADGKATFTFDGKGINGNGESVADSLYVGYSNFDGEGYVTKRAALTNTDTDPLTFTADQENMNILNELVGVDNVYAVNRNNEAVDSELGASGLLFRSEIFEVVAGENNITLSLACPALYFTVPAETTVTLTAGSFEKEFTEGNHWVAISPNIFNKTIAISYSIGGEVMKEKTLTGLTNKVYNLGTLGTVMTIADVAELIDNAEAGSTITLPVGATITGSDILVINKDITIDGNGATLRSTAGRAINVSGEGVEVAISNLNIKCTGERGVNVIENADKVTLTNVNITADNYAVNVASSAPDAEIIINGGEYNGLCTVNVNANNANVTITGATINSHSKSSSEGYAALMIGDYTGSTISVEESEINISGTSKIAESVNKESHIFVDNTEVGIPNPVAKIVYGDYAYTFSTLAEALEFAKEGDTVILLSDAEIGQVGTFNIDVNGHNLTVAEGYKATQNGTIWTVEEKPTVATVGGVEYKDLASAVAAANGGTVTLVSDVAIENLVEVSGNVTIEGNGYTVSNTGDVFKVLEGGSLTIGEGVTIESATDCGIFTSAGANNVTVVINGTVKTESSEYAAVQFNGGTTGVNLTVNGTIENLNDIALMLPAGGTYTIASTAKISGATAIYLKGGDLTIAEGATISANGATKTYEYMGSGAVSTGDALVVESCDYPEAPATATINGGTFTSTNGKAVAHYVQNETVEKATISIKGGTFNTDPSDFVAEGYAAGYNNNYIVLPVTGTTYLVPNENWKSASAWFAAWQWGKTEIMVKATDTNEDGIYEVPVLNNNTSINFDRMNPANTIADMWDGKWSEAAGATIQADKYYYVTSWNGGIWESATWERPTNVIYFVPGPWANDNAKISAWTWTGTGEGTWASKKFVDSAGVIAFDRSANWTDVIFLRTSSKENTWDGEWNRSQTTVPTDGKNQYTVNDWNSYKWELNK